LEHRHQIIHPDPGMTVSGVWLPFLDGCHSVAKSGRKEAIEVVDDALWPAQKGQPL